MMYIEDIMLFNLSFFSILFAEVCIHFFVTRMFILGWIAATQNNMAKNFVVIAAQYQTS